MTAGESWHRRRGAFVVGLGMSYLSPSLQRAEMTAAVKFKELIMNDQMNILNHMTPIFNEETKADEKPRMRLIWWIATPEGDQRRVLHMAACLDHLRIQVRHAMNLIKKYAEKKTGTFLLAMVDSPYADNTAVYGRIYPQISAICDTMLREYSTCLEGEYKEDDKGNYRVAGMHFSNKYDRYFDNLKFDWASVPMNENCPNGEQRT